MIAQVSPSPLSGNITAPPSKSEAIRALICSALSDKPTVLYCVSSSDDVSAAASSLNALGADIEYAGGAYHVSPIASPHASARLNCRFSASVLRFLLPVTGALGVDAVFDGAPSLAARPMSELYELLTAHGMKLSEKNVFPLYVSGELSGGDYCISSELTSQFASGLLLALPLLPRESSVNVTASASAPYIALTVSVMNRFGVDISSKNGCYTAHSGYKTPGAFTVGGDYSSASFMLAAGAISGQTVSISNLLPDTFQGDAAVPDILKRFGADIKTEKDYVCVKGGRLVGCSVDCSGIPDAVPVLAVLGAYSEGTTRLLNVSRLKYKESDRISALLSGFAALGCSAEYSDGTLIIHGRRPHGGIIDCSGDHRIAMAFSIAATCADSAVTILGAEAVSKSYPAFYDDLTNLKGSVILCPSGTEKI